jgi:AcrR family transcriptional regulator
MSRPALYLLFRNKTDIYRAIGERMFEMSSQATDRVLNGGGSLGEKLTVVIDQIMIEMMCQITDSPHGAELLDLKNSLAADVVEGWHARTAGQFNKAIESEAARLGVDLAARGLSAEGLAELLMDGLEGMKHRVQGAEAQRAAARQLVRVIELSLKP